MDCTSLPNLLSPKDVQNLYWLGLQQYLVLPSSQEPLRLILRSPENTRTQAGAGPLTVPSLSSAVREVNHLQPEQVKYALSSIFVKRLKAQFVTARF